MFIHLFYFLFVMRVAGTSTMSLRGFSPGHATEKELLIWLHLKKIMKARFAQHKHGR